MKSTMTLLDSELDAARMEVQAAAELVNRSLGETYRLISSAQRRIHIAVNANAARPARRAA